MTSYKEIENSKPFLYWKHIESIIDKDLANVWLDENKEMVIYLIDKLNSFVEFFGTIYYHLDENTTNIKRTKKNKSELNKYKKEVINNKIKNINQWWKKFKKEVYLIFAEVVLLKRLYVMLSKNYFPGGTLLSQFKNHTIFDITFHRVGNQRPWINSENVASGLEKLKLVASSFYEKARFLGPNFKKINITLDSDYVWVFREKDKMSVFFTHPGNIVREKIRAQDIREKKKSFQVTQPEYVLKRWDNRISLGVELKWGIKGKGKPKSFYENEAVRYLIELFKSKGIHHTHLVLQSNNIELLELAKKIDSQIPTMVFSNVTKNTKFVMLTPLPMLNSLKKVFKNFKRVKNLDVVDIFSDIFLPKDIISFWERVDAIENKGKKIYYPFIISFLKKEDINKELCIKRLCRAYFSGCAGGFIEFDYTEAFIDFPIQLYKLSKYVNNFYENL